MEHTSSLSLVTSGVAVRLHKFLTPQGFRQDVALLGSVI